MEKFPIDYIRSFNSKITIEHHLDQDIKRSCMICNAGCATCNSVALCNDINRIPYDMRMMNGEV